MDSLQDCWNSFTNSVSDGLLDDLLEGSDDGFLKEGEFLEEVLGLFPQFSTLKKIQQTFIRGKLKKMYKDKLGNFENEEVLEQKRNILHKEEPLAKKPRNFSFENKKNEDQDESLSLTQEELNEFFTNSNEVFSSDNLCSSAPKPNFRKIETDIEPGMIVPSYKIEKMIDELVPGFKPDILDINSVVKKIKNNISDPGPGVPLNLYADGSWRHGDKYAKGTVIDSNKNDIIAKRPDLFQDFELEEQIFPVGRRLIILAHFTGVNQQQNNGAELLAMLAALRFANVENGTCTGIGGGLKYPKIFSDSELVVKFWSLNRIGDAMKKKGDPKKLKYIVECSLERSKFERNGGKVEFVSGKDNIADLGYHRQECRIYMSCYTLSEF